MATTARVRMYRQGLGDCFLLTLFSPAGEKHVLIDCGVVLGEPDGDKKTRDVVAQLAKDCGHKLDVVVVTHEHWDHLSGFSSARDLFDQIEIGELWLAWTENPDDEQARALVDERATRVKKIGSAVAAWEEAVGSASWPDPRVGACATRTIGTTRSLLDFFGPGELAVKGDKTRDALAYLKSRDPGGNHFLEPGDRFQFGGANVYVLGPPRNEKWLKKDQPSKKNPETYVETAMRCSATDALLAAVEPGVAGELDPDRYKPFDEFYRIAVADAPNHPFFAEHYGFEDGAAAQSPSAPAWRRIDEDWLAATSELALQLDADTNNTSLVLAFELGDGGDVLLFVGDAQVGNWLSWQEVKFAGSNVTPDDLLSRTAFYKVGHHASHNATLRDEGLEKMKSSSLCAFIPVVQTTADKIGWHGMPFEPLVTRLQERCRRRVVRLDQGVDSSASAAFKSGVVRNALYFELEIG